MTTLLTAPARQLFFKSGLWIIPALLLSIRVPAPLAETIVLRNGVQIRNVDPWEEGDLIKCWRFGSEVGYPRSMVEKIVPDGSPPAAPPPSAAPPPAGVPAVPPPGGSGLAVKRIHDGDTLDVTDGNLMLRIRIVGIDTPEIENPRRGKPGQPFGEAARAALEKRLSGHALEIRGHGLDIYNRQLAEVFADGENIGLNLVKEGLAEVYHGDLPKTVDAAAYRRAEAAARAARRGIWSLGDRYISPRQWRKQHAR